MNDFNWLDILVIVLYFVIIIGYGLWLSRKIKSSDSYFRGERKFSWWIMMGQAFGTGTHAENFVAQTGASFHLGFAAIWYQWKNMIITPFYWLIAPWYRRSERTTVGEIIEDRYGNKMGVFYSVFAILFFIFAQGVMLKGGGKVIAIATGNMISVNSVILAMTVAFVVYSFFGGMVASAYANFIQALMIIVLSFMLIPTGLNAVGGFEGMRASLPEEFFTLFSDKVGIGAFTILMLALNGVVGITAQPHMISMCATGDTERAGRVGQTYGSFIKRFVTIGWALTGLIVAALLVQNGQDLDDPEMAFGYATRVLLLPGLTGLMVASVLAANMSSASNFMVNTGALFTQNFYKKYMKQEATDKQLLKMGRLSGVVLTMLGVLFALYIENVLQGFLFIETIAAFMGIMVFGGNLWKRANRYGAISSVITSFLAYYYLNYLNIGSWQLVYKWEPDTFGWAMLIGFIAFFIVSLVTRAEDQSKIDKYFDNMNRVSDAEVLEPDGKKPLARDYGKDLILLDFMSWFKKERWENFSSRYREDWLGFLLAWIFVIVLVFVAWLVIQF
jgi:Na+/proline symporter